jgi:hypothetical protein
MWRTGLFSAPSGASASLFMVGNFVMVHRLRCGVVVLFVALSAVPARAQAPPPPGGAGAAPPVESGRTNLKKVMADSFRLLLIEHATRIAIQGKTRRELDGPFFSDYVRSVRAPQQWNDTDGFLVNYIGHPIHGAAAAFIWVEHSPASRRQEFEMTADYFRSRWAPVIASAVYSLQFEIGPLSEASIGNVGMRPETTGWVDYVITPVGALALMVGEDAFDRVMERIEGRVQNRFARMFLRMLFGPSRAMANFAMGRTPWYRDMRPIDWKPPKR